MKASKSRVLIFGVVLAWTAPGVAQEISTVDYSDTFTLGVSGRVNGFFNSNAEGQYDIEEPGDNPVSTMMPFNSFSFNDVAGSFGAGPTVLAAATGNPGAETGMAQSGGGDASFAYGLRTDYIFEMDAFISPGDRTDITSGPTPGGGIFEAGSLSVFFRRDSVGAAGLGIYNGATETAVTDGEGTPIRIGVDDDNWHKLAVRFNHDADQLQVWVDGDLLADLDLTTFGGGAYQDYSNGAVGFGGAGAFVEDKVLWFDNVRVGAPFLYCDDFERADGPVTDWTVNSGDWNTAGGRLETISTTAEHWAWAGDPGFVLPENAVITFDLEFLAPGSNGTVGRHGGVMFCASETTNRGSGTMTGYYIDWIDRDSDRGVRFTRDDSTADALLVGGQLGDAPADPPASWRIEITGANIKVFGDEVLYVDVDDDTYRGGHLGAWTWAGDQHLAVDNVKVFAPASGIVLPCIDAPDCRISSGSELLLDGGCSDAVNAGSIVSWSWDLGDGNVAEGATIDHTYALGGRYTVSLTVETDTGESESTSREILVGDATLTYSDDFAFADGPVPGWTTATGEWRIAGESMVTGPTTVESFSWAGDTPLFAPPNVVFEFDFEFLSAGSNAAIGRHGGFQFHCDKPNARTGAGAFRGYFIDWIDRESDRGVRLSRGDAGGFAELVRGQMADAPVDPPTHWRVEVDGAAIRVFGDDVMYIDFADSTYRGGYFGYWTWVGDQEVSIDNLNVTGTGLSACIESSPALVLAGAPAQLDGSCSDSFAGLTEIVEYRWDFGDGSMATGSSVEHTYAIADTYTVTLVVEDDAGATASTSVELTVSTPLEPFADCFDRPAGPLTGWTTTLGDWNINAGGVLTVSSITGAPDGEAWAWPGDPVGALQGDTSFEFEVPSALFTGNPADGVRRHFGIYFFVDGVTTNRFAADTSGYALWWIDRESDFGLSLARFDGAGLTSLHQGTGDAILDPPLNWRVEVEGDSIRVFGDDVLYIDVVDETYRDGFLGFWVWKNMAVQFDNVLVPAGGSRQTCEIDVTCEVDAMSAQVQVSGTLAVSECGLQTEGCACDAVEVSIDGVSAGMLTLGDASFTGSVPLPAGCEPGSEHIVTVRCLSELGAGAEGSCSFVCPSDGGLQRPGDCNQDGVLNISDASCLFGFLFLGTPGALPCGDGSAGDPGNQALVDVNGDANINLSDGIFLLNFLFSGGAPPSLGVDCVSMPGCPAACTP